MKHIPSPPESNENQTLQSILNITQLFMTVREGELRVFIALLFSFACTSSGCYLDQSRDYHDVVVTMISCDDRCIENQSHLCLKEIIMTRLEHALMQMISKKMHCDFWTAVIPTEILLYSPQLSISLDFVVTDGFSADSVYCKKITSWNPNRDLSSGSSCLFIIFLFEG
jgi:hypothetical protein